MSNKENEAASDLGNGASQQKDFGEASSNDHDAIGPRIEDASDVDEGEPLQIIDIKQEKINGKICNKMELKEENLAKLMLQPDVVDKPVVIVSVTGAFRKGKSFILGFFLKYLETNDVDWLKGDDRIEGFEWRGGSKGVTSGIHIWSKPFIRENASGEKVAVLLMDTQGVFDTDKKDEDCKIFVLSTLLSSIQIYNISQMVHRHDLQHLELFTGFCNLLQGNGHWLFSKQQLVFLIRDWPHEFDHPYGQEGGNAYIRSVLKDENPNEDTETSIEENIRLSFSQIDCFLLPFPGKAVANHRNFNGFVKEIDEDFVENVRVMVPNIMSKSNLVIKTESCRKLTGRIWSKLADVLVSSLNSGDLSYPESILNVMSERWENSKTEEAFIIYASEMVQFVDSHRSYHNLLWFKPKLEDQHKTVKKKAMEKFSEMPIMINAGESKRIELIRKFEALIDNKYQCFENNIRKKDEPYTTWRNRLSGMILVNVAQHMPMAHEFLRIKFLEFMS